MDRAELKRAVKNLVRPSPLLRFERKQRRKRQLEEAMAIHEAKYWNEEFTKKMEALHRSKASHFLEAVSNEIRHRRLQIRDVFREVDEARSGSLCELIIPVKTAANKVGGKLRLFSKYVSTKWSGKGNLPELWTY